eukprot:5375063-Pleurochrysis_carterae.AAC.2
MARCLPKRHSVIEESHSCETERSDSLKVTKSRDTTHILKSDTNDVSLAISHSHRHITDHSAAVWLTVDPVNRLIAGSRVPQIINHGVNVPRTSAIYNEADASHVVWQLASVSPRMTFGMRCEERARVFCKCRGLRGRARRAAAFWVLFGVRSLAEACATVRALRFGAQPVEHCAIHSIVQNLVVRRNDRGCRAEKKQAICGAFEQGAGVTGLEWSSARSTSAEMERGTIVQQARAEQHCLENEAASERVDRVERPKCSGLRDA